MSIARGAKGVGSQFVHDVRQLNTRDRCQFHVSPAFPFGTIRTARIRRVVEAAICRLSNRAIAQPARLSIVLARPDRCQQRIDGPMSNVAGTLQRLANRHNSPVTSMALAYLARTNELTASLADGDDFHVLLGALLKVAPQPGWAS
jgi:hypothetical protein